MRVLLEKLEDTMKVCFIIYILVYYAFLSLYDSIYEYVHDYMHDYILLLVIYFYTHYIILTLYIPNIPLSYIYRAQ